MKKPQLNCGLCHELLIDYELLDCEEQQLVKEHLSECETCDQEFRFLQDLDDAFAINAEEKFDISNQVINKINRRRLAESNFPVVSILSLVVVLQIGMLMVVPPFSARIFQVAEEWLGPTWQEVVNFSGKLVPEITETIEQVIPVDSGFTAMGAWPLLMGLLVGILLLNGVIYLTAREKGH